MIVDMRGTVVDQGGGNVRSHECGWMRLSLAGALYSRSVFAEKMGSGVG